MAQLAFAEDDAALLPPPPSASLAWADAGLEGEGPRGSFPHTPTGPTRMRPSPGRWGVPKMGTPNANAYPAPAPLLFPSPGGGFAGRTPGRGGGGGYAGPSAQDRSDEAYGRFAAVMADTIDGRMSLPECLEASQKCCRDICAGLRDDVDAQPLAATERHLLESKAAELESEAATWALLFHLFGYRTARLPEACRLQLPPSQQEACDLLDGDPLAQLCCRVLAWLEGTASYNLDTLKQRRGLSIGAYTQASGLWVHTRRAMASARFGDSGSSPLSLPPGSRASPLGGYSPSPKLVSRADPDAVTREGAGLHPEDQRSEDALLEDMWRLLSAGQAGAALELCRSAGQAWRAASLAGMGPEDACLSCFSPAWAAASKGRRRAAQGAQLARGNTQLRKLWKWSLFQTSEASRSKYEGAVYAALCGNAERMLPVCPTWEAALWALVRSWLEFQVEAELSGGSDPSWQNGGDRDQFGADASGPNAEGEDGGMGKGGAGRGRGAGDPLSWPAPIAAQQPRSMAEALETLRLGGRVLDSAKKGSAEPHHRLQERLILGDYGGTVSILRSWVTPIPGGPGGSMSGSMGGSLGGSVGGGGGSFPGSFPSSAGALCRCGAQLVVLLRMVLPEDLLALHHDWLHTTGDLILYKYCSLLVGTRRDSLAGVYAAQMRPGLRDSLYLRVLEARAGEGRGFKAELLGSLLRFLPTQGEGSVCSILGAVLEGALGRVGGAGEGKGDDQGGMEGEGEGEGEREGGGGGEAGGRGGRGGGLSWGERCAEDLRAQAQALEFASTLPSLCASLAPPPSPSLSPLAAELPSAGGAGQVARQLALRESLMLSLRSGTAMLRNILLGSLSIRCEPGSPALGPLASLLRAQGVRVADQLRETQSACALLHSLALAGSAGLGAGLGGGGEGEGEGGEEGKSEAQVEMEAWEGSGQLEAQVERLEEELEDLRFLREVFEIEETLEKTRGLGQPGPSGVPGDVPLTLAGVLARQRGRAIQSALAFLSGEAQRVRPFLGAGEPEEGGAGVLPAHREGAGGPAPVPVPVPPYCAPLGGPHEVRAVLAMVLPDGVPVPGVPAVCGALAGSFLGSWRALRDQGAAAEDPLWDVTVDVGRHAPGEGGSGGGEDEALLAVRIQCLPTGTDGPATLALHSPAVKVLAAAVRGELPDLKAGVCVQVLRAEGYLSRDWGWSEGSCIPGDMARAPELTRTLCYACAIPHLALRCAEEGGRPEEGTPLVAGARYSEGEAEKGVVPLVADALHVFFSPQQLQDLLVQEREATVALLP